LRSEILLSWMISTSLFAGAMDEIPRPKNYLKFSSGGSFSYTSQIYADPIYWDASPQGYDGKLGKSALYGIAGGRHFSPLWSGDIEFIYRPSFNYAKYQTSTAYNTIFFNGDKNRYFNFESNSLMANLYLKGSGLSQRFNDFGAEPFIGGGLGLAFNTIKNFRSQRFSDGTFRGILQDNLRTSLAFQFSAGIRLLTSSNYDFDIGYRYYNASTYSSSNFIINTIDYATPWKGTFQSNEFFVHLGYKF